jgi:hypothetical protein
VRNIYAAFEVLLPQKAHEYDVIFAKKSQTFLIAQRARITHCGKSQVLALLAAR